MNKDNINKVIMAILALISVFFVKTSMNKSTALKIQASLYETVINDYLELEEDNKELCNQIGVLEVESFAQLDKIKTSNKLINSLKHSIRNSKKEPEVFTKFVNVTRLDTFVTTVIKDTVINIIKNREEYSGTFKSDWLNISSVASKDTTFYSIESVSDLSVILHRENGELLATVTDKNPYTGISDLISYKVTDYQKPKRFGLGVYMGAGAAYYNKKVVLGPQIGLGFTYNFVNF